MKSVGLIAASTAATILCIVILLNSSTLYIIAGAQAVDTPVTNASVTGTQGTNGWYITNASVNLTATDSQSPVNYTMYKLDNAASYSVYTTNLTLTDGNHTLLYYSVDKAGNAEVPKYLNVKVDTQPPVTNISKYGSSSTGSSGTWYNGTVTVNLTASDAISGLAGTYYKLDTGPYTNYTSNITLADGDHTLTYGSVDMAGNSQNYTAYIDVFDPQINVGYNTSPCNNDGWFDTDVEVFLSTTATDINYIEYSFNDINWITGSSFIISGEGNHSFYYRAVDNNGNPGATYCQWIGIDESMPVITISIAGDQDKGTGWYNGDITVYLNTYSNGSISLTQYSWNNYSWINYTGSFGVSWGMSREIYFRTTDVVGNTVEGSYFIYFRPENIDLGDILGTSSGSSPTPTPTPAPTLIPTPNPTPVPTSYPLMPTTAPTTSPPPSTDPMAAGIVMAVLALMVVAGIAAYLFMIKPK